MTMIVMKIIAKSKLMMVASDIKIKWYYDDDYGDYDDDDDYD